MQQPYNTNYYNSYYQPQVQAPMDRLQQLQAQQYQMVGTQMSLPNQPPQTNQGLLWVQGEAAAKSYLIAPNSTVLLMDSDASRFYLKSADNAGMPSLRTFEYTEVLPSSQRIEQNDPVDLDSKYVTRQEYDTLRGQYEEILEKLNSFRSADEPVSTTKGAATASSARRSKGGISDE